MGTNQSRSKRSGVNNRKTDSYRGGGGGGDDELFTATGRRKKSILLQRREEFPERIRIAIAEAGERRKSSKNHKIFLAQVQNALADWVFEAAGESMSGSGGKDGFASRGLDDRRDTRRQVEIALRCFPEVLRQRRYGLFPIMWLSKSIRSASFIPLFAKLGVELGVFQDCDRGGLVFGANGMDVFSQLAASSCCCCRVVEDVGTSSSSGGTRKNRRKGDDASHQREVDARFLGVFEELRAMNLMKRSDIRAFKIMDILCRQKVFPERRFRYFVDWDPSVLLSDNGVGGCDSNKTVSIRFIKRFFDKKDISGLKMLFELAVRYYPLELGFLFDTMYSVDGEKKPSSFRKKKRSSFGNKKKKHPDSGGSKRRMNVNDDMNRSDHTAMSLGSNSDHSRTSIPLFEHSTSLFEFACDVHGREAVEALVDSMLHDLMTKDPDFTRKALVRAATTAVGGDEDCNGGAAETVYRLLRKDPSVLLR